MPAVRGNHVLLFCLLAAFAVAAETFPNDSAEGCSDERCHDEEPELLKSLSACHDSTSASHENKNHCSHHFSKILFHFMIGLEVNRSKYMNFKLYLYIKKSIKS